jgi:hypothetical protein
LKPRRCTIAVVSELSSPVDNFESRLIVFVGYLDSKISTADLHWEV